MKYSILLASIIVSFLPALVFPAPLAESRLEVSTTGDITVYYEASLETPAREVGALYGELRRELEEEIGWRLAEAPTVILIKNRATFLRMVGSDYVAAVAIPRKQMILIDHTQMTVLPFTLRTTLKHELCHLLLHENIDGSRLPRWLDEGVAQWASDGMSEIIMKRNRLMVPRAAMTGAIIPLRQLESSFPLNEWDLLLAYEISKNIVEYILKTAGPEGLIGILEGLRRGDDVDRAVEAGLRMSLDDLEQQWHDNLRGRASWFAFAGYYLYELLFALAALLLVVAYIRYLKRKQDFTEHAEDDEDDGSKNWDARENRLN